MSYPDAFSIDERYDRVHASDRRSRYGAYLAQHANTFTVAAEPTNDPAAFAAAALEIAQPPVMSPPYVTTHRRILGTWTHRDDDGRTAVAVSLATPLPDGVTTALSWRWRSWETTNMSGRFEVPYDNDRPTAYAQLTLRIPLDCRRLPAPRYNADGTAHTATAKEAAHLAIVQLNGVLGELLPALTARRAA